MKFTIPLLFVVLALGGCNAKDRNHALSEGSGLAKSLWIRASQQAESISADASERTIAAANTQMQKLQEQLSNIKMPTEVDKLRLASVEEQIERLSYALDMKDVQAKVKAKIEDAKGLMSNAGKTEAQVKAYLGKADAEYKQLLSDYNEAKGNFDAAQTRIEDVKKRIKDAGGIVP